MTPSIAEQSESGRGRRAFIGLGSNIGDRVAYLKAAVAAIPDVDAVSAVYETDPVGGPEQGMFLNLVARLQTELSAHELLDVCRQREAEAERTREVRWGPRSLDLDLLWIDGVTVDDPELTVPHPRMFERPFVLIPLNDVGADVVPDDFCPVDDGVRRVGVLSELEGP